MSIKSYVQAFFIIAARTKPDRYKYRPEQVELACAIADHLAAASTPSLKDKRMRNIIANLIKDNQSSSLDAELEEQFFVNKQRKNELEAQSKDQEDVDQALKIYNFLDQAVEQAKNYHSLLLNEVANFDDYNYDPNRDVDDDDDSDNEPLKFAGVDDESPELQKNLTLNRNLSSLDNVELRLAVIEAFRALAYEQVLELKEEQQKRTMQRVAYRAIQRSLAQYLPSKTNEQLQKQDDKQLDARLEVLNKLFSHDQSKDIFTLAHQIKDEDKELAQAVQKALEKISLTSELEGETSVDEEQISEVLQPKSLATTSNSKQDEVAIASAPDNNLRLAARTFLNTQSKQIKYDLNTLVREAPTGTGKSLAYLIPILFSQQKVIVSTYMKSLQEQLSNELPDLILQVKEIANKAKVLQANIDRKFKELETNNPEEAKRQKEQVAQTRTEIEANLKKGIVVQDPQTLDLRALDLDWKLDHLGQGVKHLVFKGQSNYFCPRALGFLKETNDPEHENKYSLLNSLYEIKKKTGANETTLTALTNKSIIHEGKEVNFSSYLLNTLDAWYQDSKDPTKLDFENIPSKIRITEEQRSFLFLNRPECSGNACSFVEQCPYFKVREKVKESQIVIVNHNTLYSQSDRLFLDQKYNAVIVDEAHNLPHVLVNAEVTRFTLEEMINLLNDIKRDLTSSSLLKVSACDLVAPLHDFHQDLVAHFPDYVDSQALYESQEFAQQAPAMLPGVDYIPVAWFLTQEAFHAFQGHNNTSDKGEVNFFASQLQQAFASMAAKEYQMYVNNASLWPKAEYANLTPSLYSLFANYDNHKLLGGNDTSLISSLSALSVPAESRLVVRTQKWRQGHQETLSGVDPEFSFWLNPLQVATNVKKRFGQGVNFANAFKSVLEHLNSGKDLDKIKNKDTSKSKTSSSNTLVQNDLFASMRQDEQVEVDRQGKVTSSAQEEISGMMLINSQGEELKFTNYSFRALSLPSGHAIEKGREMIHELLAPSIALLEQKRLQAMHKVYEYRHQQWQEKFQLEAQQNELKTQEKLLEALQSYAQELIDVEAKYGDKAKQAQLPKLIRSYLKEESDHPLVLEFKQALEEVKLPQELESFTPKLHLNNINSQLRRQREKVEALNTKIRQIKEAEPIAPLTLEQIQRKKNFNKGELASMRSLVNKGLNKQLQEIKLEIERLKNSMRRLNDTILYIGQNIHDREVENNNVNYLNYTTKEYCWAELAFNPLHMAAPSKEQMLYRKLSDPCDLAIRPAWSLPGNLVTKQTNFWLQDEPQPQPWQLMYGCYTRLRRLYEKVKPALINKIQELMQHVSEMEDELKKEKKSGEGVPDKEGLETSKKELFDYQKTLTSLNDLYQLFQYFSLYPGYTDTKKEKYPYVFIDTNPHRNQVNFFLKPLEAHLGFAKLRNNLKNSKWILTSATLSIGQDCSRFTQTLGIKYANIGIVASPFRHHKRAYFYVQNSRSKQIVSADTAELIFKNKGRCLWLCTSNYRVKQVGQELQRLLDAKVEEQIMQEFAARNLVPTRAEKDRELESRKFNVLQQSREVSNKFLVNSLKEEENTVIVATRSFWEGVDIKGDKLSLLILDKYPNPQLNAYYNTLNHLYRHNPNYYYEQYYNADGYMVFKQGIGRLIRTEDDFGLIMLLDNQKSSYLQKVMPLDYPNYELDFQGNLQKALHFLDEQEFYYQQRTRQSQEPSLEGKEN
ncbi:helicase C-terminal domain-containing protein [Psittacicella gerlachiana]|uniref:Helicase ATP-binding domain-containing protein n=1 Tax=Psittacicella gerlachiana TaxID=2028574 RepID=A0A3A1YIQ6_9GAMM|nr:helicase C-terminal domain-containing protein [Psittacicella gerlachiana]RIY37088.1 hypothetical protein CKF59_02060 [Psittacicella gerlachiana]